MSETTLARFPYNLYCTDAVSKTKEWIGACVSKKAAKRWAAEVEKNHPHDHVEIHCSKPGSSTSNAACGGNLKRSIEKVLPDDEQKAKGAKSKKKAKPGPRVSSKSTEDSHA